MLNYMWAAVCKMISNKGGGYLLYERLYGNRSVACEIVYETNVVDPACCMAKNIKLMVHVMSMAILLDMLCGYINIKLEILYGGRWSNA